MKLGIGIIGAGGISNAHAGGYQQIPDEARIVAVADIVEEKAHAAAEHWGRGVRVLGLPSVIRPQRSGRSERVYL